MPAEIQVTSLLLIYAVSAVVTIGLTLYGLREWRTGEQDLTTLAFVGIVLSVSIWTVARFFELLFVDEMLSRFFLTIIYVGYGGAGLSTLWFSLAFTGKRRYLTRRITAALLVLPVLAVVVAATNPLHELFWTGTFEVKTGWWGELYILEREFQPAFHAYMIYVVGTSLVGIATLLRMAITSPDVYRRQTLAFAAGSGIGILMGVLFGLEAQPFVPEFIDLAPVGWGVMGLCFGYAIFEYQMLDVVPVARDSVIESMHDGYIVLDAEGRVVDLNDAALELFDEDSGRIGEHLRDELPACQDLLDEHEHGSPTERELNVTVDGEQRVLVANISSLSDGDRHIGRLFFIRDITERRAVQKRYQALIENSSDLIFVGDRDGTLSYASPAVETITGIPPEAVVGQNAFDFIHEDDQAEVRETFDELLENPGEKRRVEYRLPDQEGDWLYFEADVWNLLDNPFVEGIVTNAREITDRKERERELREMNEQLAEANERLEKFASVISHDLRNPINVAQGHVDIARETGDEESFEKIETSLERMEDIIEDVLTLAREGQSIGDTRPVSLEAIASDAWEHVATEEATLQVEDDRTFEADPDRLLQLFENCFRNAHEHAGSDVSVTVGCEDSCFYIADDGPGIPPDRREEVFEAGHTSHQNGTGLGLSIVAGIADAHGWSVEVADGTDGGARFEFCGIEPREPAR